MKLSYFLTPPALLAFVVIAAPAQAQETTAGSAEASVVEPLQITKTSDLEFGRIIPNGTGAGRVTINARTAARNGNANVTLDGTSGFGRATFVVTGESRAQINLTSSSNTITLTGPGAPMTVSRLRVNRNNGGQRTLPRTFTIPASGTMNVGFGGRLNVGNNQAAGTYTGTFDLTVTYQ